MLPATSLRLGRTFVRAVRLLYLSLRDDSSWRILHFHHPLFLMFLPSPGLLRLAHPSGERLCSHTRPCFLSGCHPPWRRPSAQFKESQGRDRGWDHPPWESGMRSHQVRNILCWRRCMSLHNFKDPNFVGTFRKSPKLHIVLVMTWALCPQPLHSTLPWGSFLGWAWLEATAGLSSSCSALVFGANLASPVTLLTSSVACLQQSPT